MGSLSLRRTDDEVIVEQICNHFLGKGTWASLKDGDTAHWILWNGDNPAGFCSAKYTGHKTVLLTGAAVCHRVRGKGLQRRMINTRLAWARSKGATVVITYTLRDNYPSITNLIKSGFRFYSPENAWVGDKVHYFRKNLAPL